MSNRRKKPGIIALTSGGLDSSLMAVMLRENGWDVSCLFIDYGHLARVREWAACEKVLEEFGFPQPQRMRLPEFGRAIKSGLIDNRLDVVRQAFLPGRNLLFLLAAASVASDRGVSSIGIGLLNEEHSLFPDQTGRFLSSAESCLSLATGRQINIVAPLSAFNKPDVFALATSRGLKGTYSCHRGGARACGNCISCNEFKFLRRN